MKISILKSHLVFEISCRFENKTAGNLKYIVKSFQIPFLTWMKDTGFTEQPIHLFYHIW